MRATRSCFCRFPTISMKPSALLLVLSLATRTLYSHSLEVGGLRQAGVESEEVKPDSCVSLLVYAHDDCSGSPMRSLAFPTWSRSGSPCYHDASMPNYSVKDQHCNLIRGTFHQNVYSFSDQCETNWFTRLFSPQEQVFSSDQCFHGFRLDYCIQGPCPDPAEPNGANDVVRLLAG